MSPDHDIFNYAIQGVGLLLAGLYVAGLIVCLVHRRVSGSMPLVAIGFGGAALVGLVRLAGPLLLRSHASPDFMQLFFLALTIAGAVCLALIVGGLALVLGDVGRRLNPYRDRDRPDDPFRRRPGYGDEDRPGYDPRDPGSRDITR